MPISVLWKTLILAKVSIFNSSRIIYLDALWIYKWFRLPCSGWLSSRLSKHMKLLTFPLNYDRWENINLTNGWRTHALRMPALHAACTGVHSVTVFHNSNLNLYICFKCNSFIFLSFTSNIHCLFVSQVSFIKIDWVIHVPFHNNFRL